MLHSKYHAPGKQHVVQYVPQPYYQVPQYQAPLMYIIPQPQPQALPQAHQAHHQPASQQPGGQPEQAAQPAQAPQQPQYVMLLSAPAAAAPSAAGFQYFNHPQLALQAQQPFITFYAGPQHHQQQHQLQQQGRFYPEQQQLVFQSQQPDGPQNDGPPHFVPKQLHQQGQQGPVGLEAPAPPSPPTASPYGSRVQQHGQHAYKTIIKA
ncbi:activating signal cointegrator 1 complex subunit 2 homolog [Thrips palmi]|uniref:Activating signal cointegrator 1 complex subunit 2 homolog n=1 Tax=Thrips palmi TaxID=161013 RepID=A0A6P8YB81_THRPL|nr:activating signal cointegrator 1 complex subunit 2 homolog [Thrips palmi]